MALPQLTVDEHHPVGRQRLAHLGGLPDQAFHAGCGPAALSGPRLGHREGEKRGGRQRQADDRRPRDFEIGRVEQQERTEHERGDPPDGQHAVCGRFDIEHEEHEGDHDEPEPGPVRVERAQRVERQEQTDHADDPGRVTARAGELEQDRIQPDRQQDGRQRRVGDRVEEALDRAQRHFFHRRIFQTERDLLAGDIHRSAVQLRQKIRHIPGDDVDHAQGQRLVGGGGRGFGHGLLGPGGRLFAAAGSQVLDVGHQDIGGLLFERVRQVDAFTAHRAGRADAAAGRHRGRMAGQGDEGARRTCMRAGRGHVDDDRHPGRGHALGDLLGDVHRPARRIQLDHQCRRAGVFSVGDGLVDVGLKDRRHRPLELRQLDRAFRLRGCLAEDQCDCQQHQQPQTGSLSYLSPSHLSHPQAMRRDRTCCVSSVSVSLRLQCQRLNRPINCVSARMCPFIAACRSLAAALLPRDRVVSSAYSLKK